MNDPIDEQLSAFIDGELPDQELELLLARVDRDPARRTRLARYAEISALLRDGAVIPSAGELADRVRDALAVAGEQVTRRPTVARFAVARWGAVAAAVAAVAIFWGGPQPGPAPLAGRDSAATPGQVPAAPLAQSRTVAPAQPPGLTTPNTARLTTYLVYHGRHTGSLSGRVVDARLLGRNMERAELRRVDGVPDR